MFREISEKSYIREIFMKKSLLASLESTCKSRISKIATRCQNWGVNHLSTFDADLRNVSFALITFMGFPAILSTLQPFKYAFTIENTGN